jgi:inner membrane protein
MSPITHFLISWTVAGPLPLSTRDKALICFAGVAPDLDGLGIVPEFLTRHSPHPLTWFSDYHHILGHNIAFAFTVTLLIFALARQRWLAALLACATFHLHLLCDLIGARGPDGYPWPIPYLLPFSHAGVWTWSGQWALNAWPNLVITLCALAFTFFLAWHSGESPLQFFSAKANRAFVEALRARIPRRGQQPLAG